MPTDLEEFREPFTAEHTVLLLIDHQEQMTRTQTKTAVSHDHAVSWPS